MLETLLAVRHASPVYRFANPRDDLIALRAFGLDEDETAAVLPILARAATPGGIQRIIEGSFEAWNKHGLPYGGESRFSTGSWPVCIPLSKLRQRRTRYGIIELWNF